MAKHTVVVQKWEESEAGWGTRPDGYSLHLSEDVRKTYVADFWKRQREVLGDRVPSEYTREDGTPYPVEVDEETFQKITENGGSLRVFNNKYPGDGGPDGWRNR